MALRRVTAARGAVDTTGRRKAAAGTGEATGRSRLEAAGSRLSVENKAPFIAIASASISAIGGAVPADGALFAKRIYESFLITTLRAVR